MNPWVFLIPAKMAREDRRTSVYGINGRTEESETTTVSDIENPDIRNYDVDTPQDGVAVSEFQQNDRQTG